MKKNLNEQNDILNIKESKLKLSVLLNSNIQVGKVFEKWHGSS